MQTTLKEILQQHPCFDGYNKLVVALGGPTHKGYGYAVFKHEEPISLEFILDSNGVADTLGVVDHVLGAHRDLRLNAV
ncbi:MAG: hypothetical protein ABTQ25_02450 [Nitrosomonas ureae]